MELRRLANDMAYIKMQEIEIFLEKYVPIFFWEDDSHLRATGISVCSGSYNFLIELFKTNDYFFGNIDINYTAPVGTSGASSGTQVNRHSPIIFTPNVDYEIIVLEAHFGPNHYLTLIKQNDDVLLLQSWADAFSMFDTMNSEKDKFNKYFTKISNNTNLNDYLFCGWQVPENWITYPGKIKGKSTAPEQKIDRQFKVSKNYMAIVSVIIGHFPTTWKISRRLTKKKNSAPPPVRNNCIVQ